MSQKKIVVIIDMDDTIVDFMGSKKLKYVGYEPMHIDHEAMYNKGFFYNLKPINGALDAVRELLKLEYLDIYIGSVPLASSHYCYSEKAKWIKKHIPELSNKIILTQNKILLKGDYLIDDSIKWKNDWEAENRVFIHYNPRKSSITQWEQIVSHFKQLKV